MFSFLGCLHVFVLIQYRIRGITIYQLVGKQLRLLQQRLSRLACISGGCPCFRRIFFTAIRCFPPAHFSRTVQSMPVFLRIVSIPDLRSIFESEHEYGEYPKSWESLGETLGRKSDIMLKEIIGHGLTLKPNLQTIQNIKRVWNFEVSRREHRGTQVLKVRAALQLPPTFFAPPQKVTSEQ